MNKIVLFLFLGVSAGFSAEAQEILRDSATIAFQNKLITEFKDPEKSPLSEAERLNFRGLDFFDFNSNFRITADFVRTPYEVPFEMPTTTLRKPIYVKYGEVYFDYKGKEFKLNVYQSQQLASDEAYKDYLFLPFTDLTNGKTSYTGGRYLDLKIPDSKKILLDFNKAYNPYCAYSGEYSCPIPPPENNLKILVEAGVRHSH